MEEKLLQQIKSELAGRFTIDRELGQGTYGTVFEARDATGRSVALKLVRPELVPERDRILRELALISRLNHPNVLPILESGPVSRQLFYSMPLVTGGSLAGRLKQGPIPLDEALRIASAIGEALGYANAHGVLHRDITPRHILFDNGQTLVKEFWIARAMSRAFSDSLTTTGVLLGTPGYMSPEQLRGLPVDARSDVYSLAVVIVEMLTNRLVFEGGSAVDIVARQVAGHRLGAKDLPTGLPKQIVDAVLVALDRDPNKRFSSAIELIAACSGSELLAARMPVAVAPAAKKRGTSLSELPPRVSLSVAGAALLMVLGVVQLSQGNFPVAGALGAIIALRVLQQQRSRLATGVVVEKHRPGRPYGRSPHRRLERLRDALRYQYDVQRELGRGGMAEVYFAEDLRYRGRRVAIKVLRAEYADSEMSERFLDEIQITARLSHPSIVPLLDSGDADGRPYYVMPYVEGTTLNDRLLRDGQLSGHDTREIIRSVARALDYAHRQQVVHRDIKPENILLHDGQASVADFGIALALDRTRDKRRTAGMIIGTPPYMSPEQFWDTANIGHRSDLYALGCVMCEMLTGLPPYTGDPLQLATLHLKAPIPDLRERRPDISPVLDTIVRTCLAKDPADRFQSAASLIDALDAGTASLPARTSLPRSQHPLLS